MTTRTSTLLALPLLLGLATGAAQAKLLEIELTGELDYGYDYTNEFGFGAGYFDLAGQTATFRWLINTDWLGTNLGDGTTYSYYNNNNPFVTASVTVNGITQTINNSYGSYIQLQEDQDGPVTNYGDYLSIQSYFYYSYSDGVGYSYSNSYSSIYAYDSIDSIINGIGVDQLDGWSTNLISNNYSLANEYPD